MKKFLLPAIIFIFSASAPAAAAQISPKASSVQEKSPGLVFVYQDQKFTPDPPVYERWKGSKRWPRPNMLRPAAQPLELELSRSYGNMFRKNPQPESYRFRPDRVYDYVKSLAEKINKQVTEPKLAIENSRMTDFVPPKNGLKVDIYKSAADALEALEKGLASTTLTVYQTSPKKNLSELNSLGIKELVGYGESSFKGSPSNRRHNIIIGVEKMKGIIVAPGEEFSFNEYLGPVEKEQGFLPELVIKRTGTVPELGGGLCQVSSTVFRAVMNSGLPVTQRRNHAYAVSYYAPQGTDATIYPGVVDLKFKNDTPAHLLIWPVLKDSNTLIFEFYGTKDSRQVILEKPVQYDKKPDGSLKAVWKREVIKNGVSSKDEFKSVYQPPALFQREEKFISSSSTPASSSQQPAEGSPVSLPAP